MAKLDLKRTIYAFHANSREERFASYDFCYDYFQSNKGNLAANMAQSCFRLWGYLASWGMLRGSSELLQKSPAVLEPLITYFDSIASDSVWDYDVPDYQDHAKVERILKVCEDIRGIMSKIVSNPSNTLITKIILGTLGLIPAFDTYFVSAFRKEYEKTCKFTKVDAKALDCLYDFYLNNQTELNAISVYVIDFQGNKTGRKYKIAKLIDMYGFTKGATKDDVLPGKFSVARGKQVQFSKGNLQYLPVENIWRFAEHQQDIIGSKNMANKNNAVLNEWTDLHSFDNWGQYFKSEDSPVSWRALTREEWVYLFSKRKDADKLILKVAIDDVKGLLLLPDNWDTIEDKFTFGISVNNDFSENRLNCHQAEDLYNIGVVFLPLAGMLGAQKAGAEMFYTFYNLWEYWSSTECTNENVGKKEYKKLTDLYKQLGVQVDANSNLFDKDAFSFPVDVDSPLEKLNFERAVKNRCLAVRLVQDC